MKRRRMRTTRMVRPEDRYASLAGVELDEPVTLADVQRRGAAVIVAEQRARDAQRAADARRSVVETAARRGILLPRDVVDRTERGEP